MDKAEVVFKKHPRRFGNPRTDVERVMSHYKVTKTEALKMLDSSSIKKLLPTRGSGITTIKKAEIVFQKYAGVWGKMVKVFKKTTKKPEALLKPIGAKITPRKQMLDEYQKNYKTWTDGIRPVSLPDKEKLLKQLAADRYKKKIF